jgi:hypothetical protein
MAWVKPHHQYKQGGLMATIISKGDLLSLFGIDAFMFVSFITMNDPQAQVINKMWDSVTEINLESPLVRDSLIPMLLVNHVISQTTYDRVIKYIEFNKSPVTDKKFLVPIPNPLPIGPDSTISYNPTQQEIAQWVSNYCDCDFKYFIDSSNVIITTIGNCTAPNVKEIK